MLYLNDNNIMQDTITDGWFFVWKKWPTRKRIASIRVWQHH